MRHFFFIDPIEKLNVRKDSSLMLALSMQRRGIEAFVFFESDFSIQNQGDQKIDAYSFEGTLEENEIYLKSFHLKSKKRFVLTKSDTIHMRLDPPFDSRYLRILWMLDFWKQKGINVINNPRGIMNFNEKLYAYGTEGATPSFVGESAELAKEFLEGLGPMCKEVILKPMDLYSGIGVEKLSLSHWEKRFQEKRLELKGPIIVQPFVEAVKEGEVRAIYFKQQEIGSILKIPKSGEYLSNIAQGATFKSTNLSHTARKKCEKIMNELSSHGVDWAAFDILGDAISEVNITCPGLLVEVSYAYKKNLADQIIDLLL